MPPACRLRSLPESAIAFPMYPDAIIVRMKRSMRSWFGSYGGNFFRALRVLSRFLPSLFFTDVFLLDAFLLAVFFFPAFLVAIFLLLLWVLPL